MTDPAQNNPNEQARLARAFSCPKVKRAVTIADIYETVSNKFWWIMAGVIGRLMFHSREAQAGRRSFWGRELPFELVVAVSMGLIGYSVCAYFKLEGPVSAGVVSAIAYLGPRALDTLFERLSGAAATVFSKKGD
jgi:hypothetical protein